MDTQVLKTQKTQFAVKIETILVCLLLMAYFLVQLGTLNHEPWEKFETWRQSDTYSIAVNYVQYGMDFLKPQFNYDGASGNTVQLELQIVPYMSALIFKLTGTATPIIPRLMGLMFFLGSAIFLYLILKSFTQTIPALLGLGIYLFLPISMLYSRAIMPEPCALFFYCGGVYFLLRWDGGLNQSSVWLSAVFTAFAVMEKTPLIFTGILVLAVFLWKFGRSILRRKEFYGYGIISLVIPAAYYIYASRVSAFRFVEGITVKHIFSEEILSIFTMKGLNFFQINLPKYFTWPVLLLALIGFLLCFHKERRFLLVWALAFAVECVTIVAVIRFGYYLIFIAPILSVLCAIALGELWLWKKQIAVVLCSLTFILVLYSGHRLWKSSLNQDERITQTGALIESVTAPHDLVVSGSLDPSYLNAADRRGWRANLKYYDYIPEGPQQELVYFMERGASWFVVEGGEIYGDDGSYLNYLQTHYPLYAENAYCSIYKLR